MPRTTWHVFLFYFIMVSLGVVRGVRTCSYHVYARCPHDGALANGDADMGPDCCHTHFDILYHPTRHAAGHHEPADWAERDNGADCWVRIAWEAVSVDDVQDIWIYCEFFFRALDNAGKE